MKKTNNPIVDVLICTPSIKSESFNICYDSLIKTTKEFKYSLRIFDNMYSDSFHHPTEINKFMDMCDGYCVLCDDDVEFLDNDWLSNTIRLMEDNEDIGMCGFHIVKDYKNKINVNYLLNYLYVISCCIIIRKTNIRMNTSFLKHSFDLDFCFRMWKDCKKRVCMSPYRIIHSSERRQSIKNTSLLENYNKTGKIDRSLLWRMWNKESIIKLIEEIEIEYPNIVLKKKDKFIEK